MMEPSKMRDLVDIQKEKRDVKPATLGIQWGMQSQFGFDKLGMVDVTFRTYRPELPFQKSGTDDQPLDFLVPDFWTHIFITHINRTLGLNH